MWMFWPKYLRDIRIYGDMAQDKKIQQDKIDKRAAKLRENLRRRKVVAKAKQEEKKQK